MMQCFMKKEDKSLIDVENVETTYFDNCAFFAALASFLQQFCLIRLSLASIAFCVPGIDRSVSGIDMCVRVRD